MRVLFFLRSFPVVSETFVTQQIRGVIERGHDLLITSDHPTREADIALQVGMDLVAHVLYRPRGQANRYLRALQTLGLTIYHGWRAPETISRALDVSRYGREARSGWALRALLPMLSAKARAFEADIVHAHFGPAGVLAAILKDLGVITAPLVVTFHGYDAHVVPRRMGPGYYDRLFESADRIMVGTEFMKSTLLALGAPAERMTILPMGVDTSRFRQRAQGEHDGGPPIIISVARLVRSKGIHDGLLAFQQTLRDHPQAEYQVAGDGPERPALEEMARDLGIADHVTFLGNQTPEQLAERYAKATVFLHPSKRGDDGWVEGQGVVLAEAAASGLPIVASRIGGIPETVIDNEIGLLAEAGDWAGFAAHLKRLLGDDQLRTEMGRRGRRLIEERLEQGRLDDQLIEVYQEIVSGASARAEL